MAYRNPSGEITGWYRGNPRNPTSAPLPDFPGYYDPLSDYPMDTKLGWFDKLVSSAVVEDSSALSVFGDIKTGLEAVLCPHACDVLGVDRIPARAILLFQSLHCLDVVLERSHGDSFCVVAASHKRCGLDELLLPWATVKGSRYTNRG